MFVRDFQKSQENTYGQSLQKSKQGFDTYQGVSHNHCRDHLHTSINPPHVGDTLGSPCILRSSCGLHSASLLWDRQSDLGYFKFTEHMHTTSTWHLCLGNVATSFSKFHPFSGNRNECNQQREKYLICLSIFCCL